MAMAGVAGWVLGLAAAQCCAIQPTAAATAGYDSYVRQVEGRLAHRRGSEAGFERVAEARLRRGELVIEKVNPDSAPELPGAMLHHWRGMAFVPGAHAADFNRVMRDFDAYPQFFSPQVIGARVLSHDGDRYQVRMRVRQKHVLTVVLDTTYDVVFGEVDSRDGYSISRSTAVAEIEDAGEPDERALTPAEDDGFLWRLNTYWTYEERDGGLYLEIETVSLTRAIPAGLGWAVGPFVESVPRESLAFTLSRVCAALRGSGAGGVSGVSGASGADARKQP